MRQDLYYRLNGVTIVIPPLRERRDEIMPLAREFAARAARTAGGKPVAFSAAASALLEAYAWPGNIRELRNVVERAVLLVEGRTVDEEHLPAEKMRALPAEAYGVGAEEVSTSTAGPMPTGNEEHTQRTRAVGLRGGSRMADDLRAGLASAEKQLIEDALARCNGNQTRAAKLLGISRRALIDRLDAYGISRPRKGR